MTKPLFISAIVLAAGTSSRMGKPNKLLLDIKGKSLIERTLRQVQQSTANEIIVVLGHEESLVREKLDKFKNVKFVINHKYKGGMTSSIQTGVANTHSKSQGFLICPSDMPALSSEVINRLINQLSLFPNDQKIIVPTYQHQKGNPILFDSHYRHEILSHSQPNGCRAIITNHFDKSVQVEVGQKIFFEDIDTPEAYQEWLKKTGDKNSKK